MKNRVKILFIIAFTKRIMLDELESYLFGIEDSDEIGMIYLLK